MWIDVSQSAEENESENFLKVACWLSLDMYT